MGQARIHWHSELRGRLRGISKSIVVLTCAHDLPRLQDHIYQQVCANALCDIKEPSSGVPGVVVSGILVSPCAFDVSGALYRACYVGCLRGPGELLSRGYRCRYSLRARCRHRCVFWLFKRGFIVSSGTT